MSSGPWRAIVTSGVALMIGGCAGLGTTSAGNPRLSGLNVRATEGGFGALNPAFSENAFDYRVDVKSDVGEAAIIPRAKAPFASRISVNGEAVSSGAPQKIRLAVGDNPVRIEVRDRAGRSATYTVTITREDIRPVVDSFEKLTYRDPETGITMGYRLFVPEGYDPTKTYPLVLFLHGAGESGSDNEIHLTASQGATVWAKPQEQARHPCFVLAPQNPKDPKAASPSDFGRMGWTTLMRKGFNAPFEPEPALRTAFAVLQKVVGDYSIDSRRVYATGLSMGGFGVFAMNVEHPDTFAAIVAICGGLDPARASALAGKPTWIFHAVKDPIVDVSFSRKSVQALRDAAGNPRYTEYGKKVYIAPTAHQSWVPAYASGEMRDWLFEQSK
jgi:predicted peptidase